MFTLGRPSAAVGNTRAAIYFSIAAHFLIHEKSLNLDYILAAKPRRMNSD